MESNIESILLKVELLQPDTNYNDAMYFNLLKVGEMSSNPQDVLTKANDGKLFTYNCMRWFPKLQEINLDDCESLGMVFDFEEYSQPNGKAPCTDAQHETPQNR